MVRFLFLALCSSMAVGQSIFDPQEWFSRLDYLNCSVNKKFDKFPEANEYGLFPTRFARSDAGPAPVCRVRNNKAIKFSLPGIGQQVFYLYSSGYLKNETYPNQVIQNFSVDCGNGMLAFFNVTELQLQEKVVRGSDGVSKCVDYISIDRGAYGTSEACGSNAAEINQVQFEEGKLSAIFRSSEKGRFKGFAINVICFRREDGDQEGCTEFTSNQTVTGNDTMTGNNTMLGNGTTTPSARSGADQGSNSRTKRSALDRFYGEIHRRRRRAVFYEEVRVAFGMSVGYRDNTITFYQDSEVDGSPQSVREVKNIRLLQTFDADREINAYKESADVLFRGPGPMFIVSPYAYFQLFAIDPRGIAPNEQEEALLGMLNENQLDLLDVSKDVLVDDPDPPTLGPIFPFSRRASSGFVSRRNVKSKEEMKAVIREALPLERACNPVLRTSARNTLMEFEEALVKEVRDEVTNV